MLKICNEGVIEKMNRLKMQTDEEFDEMFKEFQRLYPLNDVIDRVTGHGQTALRLRIYEYNLTRRAVVALERIAEKMK